ncbi:Hypothetical predicted protein [Lecanosticta acicola]|uniref:DUF3669 domain-containing protein n=1 Tax=Lecanosticta acicola TaxID=111012 RepID=A0AAI8YRW5_9PEZI|nr:Hypothetical predicted protein [Lecanosticta acicola]
MEHSRRFRRIGQGHCGSVWAEDTDIPTPTDAIKREDMGEGRSLLNDSIMHKRIEYSLKEVQATLGFPTHVNIPAHREYIRNDDDAWWRHHASSFPSGYEHCNTLVTERILPFQTRTREKLIDLFCPRDSRELVKRNPQDTDCIVRSYLGRRTHNPRPSRFFKLRNKPLHMDQMESMSLPVESYARVMAEALAVIYWHAKTDARDVEFVLAPSRPGEQTFGSDILGPHRMWILDFDCVREITVDKDGVEKAAQAFLGDHGNDPYFPRPGNETEMDRKLWTIFSDRFLACSKMITGDSELPEMLIHRIEEFGEERRAKVSTAREE